MRRQPSRQMPHMAGGKLRPVRRGNASHQVFLKLPDDRVGLAAGLFALPGQMHAARLAVEWGSQSTIAIVNTHFDAYE